MLVRSPLLTSYKWHELVFAGRLVCRCHGVFFSGVAFVLVCFVFRLEAFVEAAALRSIVLQYAGVPIATGVSLSFLFAYLEIDDAFSEYSIFLYYFRFLFVWRVRRTSFPSGWCFFYLVTTGWIFNISLCENSIKQIKAKNTTSSWHCCPFKLITMQGHQNTTITKCTIS